MTAASIVHRWATPDGVEPVVPRRIEAALTICLDRPHLVVPAAMRWTNSHLYEIGTHVSLSR